MAFSAAALAAEILADPQAYGFAAMVAAGNDQGIADTLNLIRAGVPNRVNVGLIPSYQVVNALVPADLATRTPAQLTQLGILTGAGQVDAASPNVQAQFLAIFDVATAPATRAALVALAKRQGSRAEALLGPGVQITNAQVANALGRS